MIRNPPAMTIMAFGFWENIAPKSFSEPAPPPKKKTKQTKTKQKQTKKRNSNNISQESNIVFLYIQEYGRIQTQY